MAGTIKKPDANPLAALLLTLLIFNLGHLLINGQQRKWLYSLIAIMVGSIIVIPGLVLWVLSFLDAQATAERLQKGEEIGENEYTNPTFFKIMSMIDKEATLKPGA